MGGVGRESEGGMMVGREGRSEGGDGGEEGRGRVRMGMVISLAHLHGVVDMSGVRVLNEKRSEPDHRHHPFFHLPTVTDTHTDTCTHTHARAHTHTHTHTHTRAHTHTEREREREKARVRGKSLVFTIF